MIYLNNAATSFPRPKCVLEAVSKYLETTAGDISRSATPKSNDILSECRCNLAQFFNIKNKNQIIFTSGGTASLNYALKGIQLKDAHIITTSWEHNSVLRPLMELKKELNLSITIVDHPNLIEKKITQKSKIVIVNHCSNVTGEYVDIDAIGVVAKKNNLIYIVDASQSAGMIPIDIQKSKIDILAFTGHKSLYALQGIGGLYINEDINLSPLIYGGTGTNSELITQPKEMPFYYESGTPNLPGIISLNEGISFIKSQGLTNIYNHKKKLINLFISKIKNIDGIEIHNTSDQNTMCSFNIKRSNPQDIGYILEESFDIVTRTGLHCSPLFHKKIGTFPDGSIRISPSIFNNENDIIKCVDAIKNIVENFIYGNHRI